MDQGSSDLAARISLLDERLGRVERFLGIAAKPAAPAARPAPPSPPAPVIPPAASPPSAYTPQSPVGEAPRKAPPAPVRFAPPVARATSPAPRATAREARSAFSIEKIIGARLFAGLGALAIVIGAGLFLKFAYDQGWMGRIPPLGKCALAGAFGFVLLGAGEWARRRINALASAGLSSAGVGVLYATAFGAYAQWELVSSAGAVGLLMAACIIGLAIGARAGLLSVTGISLVGGYMAPLIIGPRTAVSPAFLPTYFTGLFIVGLALSGWKGRVNAAFHHLRTICWIGTGGLGTIWLLGVGIEDEQAWALAFLGAIWAVTHVERIASLQGLFGASRTPDVAAADGRALRPGAWSEGQRASFREGRAIMGSFSATAWATGFGAWALDTAGFAPTWWAPAALFIPVSLVGLALAGNLRGLREAPRTQGERFGVGMLTQAGALLILIIALAFSGWTQAIAWLGLGLSSIVAGRWMRSRALDWYGVVSLTFATARLAILILVGASAGGVGQSYWGVYIDTNSLRIALTALAWLIAGGLLLIRLAGARPWGASAALLVGLTLLLFVPLHRQSEPGPICMFWMGVGAAALLAGCWARFGADRMVNGALLNFGLFAMTLGTVRQITITLTALSHNADGALLAGIYCTADTWRIVTAAGVWLITAAIMLTNRRDALRAHAIAASQVGLALLALAPVHPRSADDAICLAWLGLASAAFVLGARVLPRWMGWSVSGIALLTLSTGAWAVAYFDHGWSATTAPIGLHPGLWVAMLIGAVGVVAARWFNPLEPGSSERKRVMALSMALATALFFVASSFEVARGATEWASQERARQAVLSIYWGLFAVGLLVAGFLRGAPLVRYAGLGLMAIAAAKAVLIDLSAAPPAWRIASFTGLGLLMVGVALAYARIAARLDGARADRADAADSPSDRGEPATPTEDGL